MENMVIFDEVITVNHLECVDWEAPTLCELLLNKKESELSPWLRILARKDTRKGMFYAVKREFYDECIKNVAKQFYAVAGGEVDASSSIFKSFTEVDTAIFLLKDNYKFILPLVYSRGKYTQGLVPLGTIFINSNHIRGVFTKDVLASLYCQDLYYAYGKCSMESDKFPIAYLRNNKHCSMLHILDCVSEHFCYMFDKENMFYGEYKECAEQSIA